MESFEEFGQFISLSAFAADSNHWGPDARLPKYQKIKRLAPHLIYKGDLSSAKRIFFTHRWDHPVHPDHSGWQLRAILNLSRHYNYRSDTICFWYDYMSLPQKRRSMAEKAVFQRGLSNIRRLVGMCDNISLISQAGMDHSEDLSLARKRGWILFELYIARRNMRSSMPLFQREAMPIDYARAYYRGWDDVVPELSTQVPTDSRELIHEWFVRNGIECTNGSDLVYLSGLLHDELSRFDSKIPPPGIEFGEEIDLSDEEIVRYAIIRGSNLSKRFPNLYIRDLDRFLISGSEGRWRGLAHERLPLPSLDTWVVVPDDAAELRLVDFSTGSSSMYPGVKFEFRGGAGAMEMRVTLR